MDAQLQSEVESGQLIRGNSEWASPPFATKEFAKHRRQRKRRLVVDYRRVNRRTLRAIYCVRSADGTLRCVAGSALMSLLDACKGFNLRSTLLGLAQWGLGEPRNSAGVLWLVRATANGQLMCVLVIGATGARQGEASF